MERDSFDAWLTTLTSSQDDCTNDMDLNVTATANGTCQVGSRSRMYVVAPMRGLQPDMASLRHDGGLLALLSYPGRSVVHHSDRPVPQQQDHHRPPRLRPHAAAAQHEASTSNSCPLMVPRLPFSLARDADVALVRGSITHPTFTRKSASLIDVGLKLNASDDCGPATQLRLTLAVYSDEGYGAGKAIVTDWKASFAQVR